MIISFQGPTFFAAADEDCFFRWLASLPEYRGIRGTGTTLELTLESPVELDTVRQLLVIFRRWLIDITPLLPLRSRRQTFSRSGRLLNEVPGAGANSSFKPNRHRVA